MDQLVSTRRRIRRGEALLLAGDAFRSLYAIRTGYFKLRVTAGDGRDQVTGFQMAGELMGMDGIGTGRHACDAVALEDSDVCAIPFSRLEELSHEVQALKRHFNQAMSREIVRAHEAMLMLGSMKSEERLAAFVLDLAERLRARGYSSTELVLRMTREEIGSYLGLKLETVSRAFSKFQDGGLIEVNGKHIRIADPAGLRRMTRMVRTCAGSDESGRPRCPAPATLRPGPVPVPAAGK